MKVLSFSRLSLVCGLVLGLMVLWAAAAPTAMSLDSLKGGWYQVPPGYCCESTTWDVCPNGVHPVTRQWLGCTPVGKPVIVCTGANPDKGCYPYDEQICFGSSQYCWIANAQCW